MEEVAQVKRLYRTTKSDKAIAGVCGGVARYLGLDPLVVRILWVIGTIISVGIGLIAYLVIWIAAPPET